MSKLIKRKPEAISAFRDRNLGLPRLTRDDIIRKATEVVEETTVTDDFIRRLPFVEPPLSRGAQVKAATLHGFLVAMNQIPSFVDVAEGTNDHVRITYTMGTKGEPLLLLEVWRHGVWAKVALEARRTTHKGFDCVVSAQRTANIAGALAAEQEKVVVGVDAQGLCIGPYSMPFAIPIDGWHAEPVIETPDLRVALPTKDLASIVDRIAVAGEPGEWSDFQSASAVLLNFGFCEESYDLWVAAACGRQNLDGSSRMHRLTFEHARVEQLTRTSKVHQGAYVTPWFFSFLRDIADGEWVGLEVTGKQVIGRGRDFLVVASATIPTVSDPGPYPIVEIIPSYRDVWIASRDDVLQIAEAMLGPGHISIEGKLFVIHDKSTNTEAFAGVTWDARGGQVSSTRRVYVGKSELVNAVKGCPSGMMRIGYNQRRNVVTNDLCSYFVFASTDGAYEAKLEAPE